MVAPDVQFTTKECTVVLRFQFLKGKTARDIR
jgi:hypothetical protein